MHFAFTAGGRPFCRTRGHISTPEIGCVDCARCLKKLRSRTAGRLRRAPLRVYELGLDDAHGQARTVKSETAESLLALLDGLPSGVVTSARLTVAGDVWCQHQTVVVSRLRAEVIAAGDYVVTCLEPVGAA